MKKLLFVVVLLVSFGIFNINVNADHHVNAQNDVKLVDFEDSGEPEYVYIDFEDSGEPEYVYIDFEDSGEPEYVYIDFEDSGEPEYVYIKFMMPNHGPNSFAGNFDFEDSGEPEFVTPRSFV